MKAVATGMGHWPSGGMAPTAQATMPEALRGFLERFQGSGLEAGLGGLTGLATPTPPDILPDGARFLAGSYSNQAGSRAYKLYVPSSLSRPDIAAGGHAARLHPVARRLRRRHAA